MTMERKPIFGSTIVYSICIAAIFLFLEVLLGCYMYSVLKSDFHQAFLKEVSNGVCRDELRRILKEPEFADYVATSMDEKKPESSEPDVEFLEPFSDGKKIPDGDSWVRLTEASRISLKSIQNFCKATVEYCPPPSSFRTRRLKRSINGYQILINDHRINNDIPGKIDKTININAAGKPGPPGPPGPRGPAGPPGHSGLTGMKGASGLPGASGPTGLRGVKGETGLTGLRGQKGDHGLPGLNGLPGSPGVKGESGKTGSPGVPGLNGLPGRSGMKGDKGDYGLPGLNGIPGIGPGEKGDKGENGLPGLSGLPGSPGVKGAKGEPGTPGAIVPTTPKSRPEGYADGERENWRATPYGDEQYPILDSRTAECILQTVGEPKVTAYISLLRGSWMVDSYPPEQADSGKGWVTTYDQPDTLYEYSDLRSEEILTTHSLNPTFQGNDHVIYHGSFFYQPSEPIPLIVKQPLNSQPNQILQVPGLTAENARCLYNTSYNYLDFSVDENGLWVIFAVPDTNNTGVMKIDTDTMRPWYIWNITVDHLRFAEMFVASGMLYGVEDTTRDNIRISHVLDLYTEKHHAVDIDVKKFEAMTMAAYDFRDKQLMTINGGSLVSYPVTCGSNETDIAPE